MTGLLPFPLLITVMASSALASPPPIVTIDQSSEVRLAMWFPGEVRCGDEALIEGAEVLRPFNSLIRGSEENAEPLQFSFSVDSSGRTRSIRREGGRYNPVESDASAALAASRFPAGQPLKSCGLTYRPQIASMQQAPLAEVVSFSIAPPGRPPKAVWERIGAGRDCMIPPRPQQLIQVMPDFSKIAARPGARSWTLIEFDIDSDGHTQSAEVAVGTGNDELDIAAKEAISQSRFTSSSPKTGCLFPYWRNPSLLEAPAMPDHESPCDDPVWERKPVLNYPDAFEKRMVEGWALVRYDIAPWGETGNVEIIDAQPASDFGDAASAMLDRAQHRSLDGGATGCIAKVVYVLPDERGMPSPTLDLIDD